MQKLIISSFCMLLLVFFKLVGTSHVCLISKCGDDQGAAIHFPLHISRKHHCGNPGLECNGRYEQQILVKLFVKDIDYKRQEIQVYPPGDPRDCLLLKPVEITNKPISPKIYEQQISEMQKLIISSFCILLLVFFKLVGASPAIHFPLRISRKHHCGNPGLECNVRYEQQILVKLFVKHTDYKRQEIQVYGPSDCLLLKPVEITNKQISPFKPISRNFSYFGNSNVTLFSCPTSVARDTYYGYQVPCLSHPGSRIYAIYSYYQLGNLIPDLRSCSKMYDVSSVPFGEWVSGSSVPFKWSEPNCRKCEAQGNRCRWKNDGTNSEIKCLPRRKPSKDNIYIHR
ncbi:hypothetical protein DVH24_006215 [Malus domestica]|uniref:RING-type E3 ubiquitin transferase n=1 Tax=Malus domestica TaxID=3750 RepID=A0A498KBR1_MALDO|nr:hypothetical protein DVH24_006215 [Malus domestica]